MNKITLTSNELEQYFPSNIKKTELAELANKIAEEIEQTRKIIFADSEKHKSGKCEKIKKVHNKIDDLICAIEEAEEAFNGAGKIFLEELKKCKVIQSIQCFSSKKPDLRTLKKDRCVNMLVAIHILCEKLHPKIRWHSTSKNGGFFNISTLIIQKLEMKVEKTALTDYLIEASTIRNTTLYANQSFINEGYQEGESIPVDTYLMKLQKQKKLIESRNKRRNLRNSQKE